jgi:hypothetical protein
VNLDLFPAWEDNAAGGPRSAKGWAARALGELDFPCRPRQLSLTTFEEKTMRIFNAVSHPITAIVTLAMLAGCSGGSSQLSPATVGQNTGAEAQYVYQPAL